MRNSKSSPEREFHSITDLPQGAKKISSKQFNPTPKITRKRTIRKARVIRRKEKIKLRVKINYIESKKKYKRSMKPRAVLLKR